MHPAAPVHVQLDADSRRAELVALVPGLEIVLARALGPGDDARDATQEVLARALHAIESGRNIHGPLAAFVHGIAAHVIADVRRARVPVTDVDTASLPAPVLDALQLLIDKQERVAMRAAVARLDPEERELLRRCFVEGEKTSVIAAHLGEPPSRVRKRKSRALERLRGFLNAIRPRSHTSPADATRKP